MKRREFLQFGPFFAEAGTTRASRGRSNERLHEDLRERGYSLYPVPLGEKGAACFGFRRERVGIQHSPDETTYRRAAP